MANLAGIPAISVPIDNNNEKMPFGIQIMGNRKDEKKLLKFAERLQAKTYI